MFNPVSHQRERLEGRKAFRSLNPEAFLLWWYLSPVGERAKVYDDDDDDDDDDKWVPINKQASEKQKGIESNVGALGTDKTLT